MRTGRLIPPLTLTQVEREALERWARRPKTAQAVAQQAPDPRMRRRQNQMRATRCGRPQSRRTHCKVTGSRS